MKPIFFAGWDFISETVACAGPFKDRDVLLVEPYSLAMLLHFLLDVQRFFSPVT